MPQTPEELEERLELVEVHVMGQNPEQPGLLMRMDRVETIAKVILAIAGCGLVFEILKVAGALIAKQAAP